MWKTCENSAQNVRLALGNEYFGVSCHCVASLTQ